MTASERAPVVKLRMVLRRRGSSRRLNGRTVSNAAIPVNTAARITAPTQKGGALFIRLRSAGLDSGAERYLRTDSFS